jgi:deazaflavin-dependent oxidoreductase (nitroreductase family)
MDMTIDMAVVRGLALGPESSAQDHTIDITTIGARTGKPRRIEIWFHRVDGRWYLSGMPVPRSWNANLRANPRFTVHLKHGVRADLPATAYPVDDHGTRKHVLTEILKTQDRPAAGGRAPRQRLSDWLAKSPLVEIVFDDQDLAAAASTYRRT